MTMNEKRIRQIIREETARAIGGKRTIRESYDDDGRWVVGDGGYGFKGNRALEEAWRDFTAGVRGLERFMDSEFEDTESGDMASVGEIAVHQTQTFLTGR